MQTIPQHRDSQGYQVGCDTEHEQEVELKISPLPRSGLQNGKEGALVKAQGRAGGNNKFVIRYLCSWMMRRHRGNTGTGE
jgi:hypothetical protein